MKKVISVVIAGVLCLGLAACGGQQGNGEPEKTELSAVSAEVAQGISGTYEFTEEVSFNGNEFTTPWTLELKEDGTYQITTENMMGKDTYTGTYTVNGDIVTTGTPLEDEINILSNWFNNDYSCDWLIIQEKGECVPVNYGDGVSGLPDAGKEAASFADQYAGESYLDVPYASVSESETMDIFLPESSKSVPVVMMIHGGAFMFGDKEMEQVSKCFQTLLDHNYAVATINYRLADEAVYPGAVADAKAAVRYLKANAEKYGIDGDNIYVWGESAGAYLANMVAETADVEELNGDVKDNLEYDSSVKALVSFFAPVDWYHMDEDFQALGVSESDRPMGLTATDRSGESTFLGQNIAEDEAVTMAANPITYIPDMSQADLYAFIEHGDADVNVPYVQSERLYDALSEKYGAEKVTLKILKGAVHEDDAFYTEENLGEIIRFLDGIPH